MTSPIKKKIIKKNNKNKNKNNNNNKKEKREPFAIKLT